MREMSELRPANVRQRKKIIARNRPAVYTAIEEGHPIPKTSITIYKVATVD